MTTAERMAAKFQAELEANGLSGICAVIDENGETHSANTASGFCDMTTLAARMIVEYATTNKKKPVETLSNVADWAEIFGDIDVAEQEKTRARQVRQLDIFTDIVNNHSSRA